MPTDAKKIWNFYPMGEGWKLLFFFGNGALFFGALMGGRKIDGEWLIFCCECQKGFGHPFERSKVEEFFIGNIGFLNRPERNPNGTRYDCPPILKWRATKCVSTEQTKAKTKTSRILSCSLCCNLKHQAWLGWCQSPLKMADANPETVSFTPASMILSMLVVNNFPQAVPRSMLSTTKG